MAKTIKTGQTALHLAYEARAVYRRQQEIWADFQAQELRLAAINSCLVELGYEPFESIRPWEDRQYEQSQRYYRASVEAAAGGRDAEDPPGDPESEPE